MLFHSGWIDRGLKFKKTLGCPTTLDLQGVEIAKMEEELTKNVVCFIDGRKIIMFGYRSNLPVIDIDDWQNKRNLMFNS